MVLVEHRLGAWAGEVDRLVVLDGAGRVAADGPVVPTLAARAAELAAHGVWVPGIDAPAPLAVPTGLVAPAVRPASPVPDPPADPAERGTGPASPSTPRRWGSSGGRPSA